MSVSPKYIPLYFAPDQDPSWTVNPGVCVYTSNFVPTIAGTLQNWVSTSSEVIGLFGSTAQVSADIPRSAAVLKRVNASTASRYFVGTDNRLLEYQTTGSALTDVSRTAGGPYNASEWTFSAFGDIMFATCASPSNNAQATEYPQFSQGAAGTAFANLTGSPNNPPKARIGVVQQNFLLLFDVTDGSTWYADGWMCSGLGNTAKWTTVGGAADLTTQANNGRLLATPGPIRNAVKQRDTVVVYKQDSMYVMTYTGNPYTWSTRLISNNIGQSTSGGVAVVNGVHYFCHRNGVYKFDGSYPQNIGEGIVNNFLSKLNPSTSFYTSQGLKAAVSEDQNLIIWYWPTGASVGVAGGIDSALAYNYVTGKFGFIDRIWDDQSAFIGAGCPLVGTRSEIGSPAEAPVYPFVNFGVNSGTGFITARGVNIGKGSQTGETTSTIITGDIGDEYAYTKLTRIKPRLVMGDGDLQSSTLYIDGKASQGDYYVGQGMLLTATTSGAGAAAVGALLRTYATFDRPTVAASDYMTFTVYPVQGSASTTVGVHLIFGDASTADFTTTLATTGSWQTVSQAMAAFSGKTIVNVYAWMVTAGAAGTQQWGTRDIRITDSAQVLRRRICFAGEERTTAIRTFAGGTVSAGTIEDAVSYGNPYTYDTTKRRFDGTTSNRWLRARLTLYNKTDLAGIYLTATTPAGTE